MKQFNLIEIKTELSDIHGKFIKKVGQVPFKLDSDNHYFLSRVEVRLSSILKILNDLDVIEVFDEEKVQKHHEESYTVFLLKRKGFSKDIMLWTNGIDIVIRNNHCPIVLDQGKDVLIFRNINFDEFDWKEFSKKLLEFIHAVAYNRMKAIELTVFDSIN